MRAAGLLILLLAAGLLPGCYGKHLVKEPVNVHETREEVAALRDQMRDLSRRMDAMQAEVEESGEDQRALKASLQIQLDEILAQLRSLTVQTQELMNLTARRQQTGTMPSAGDQGREEPP
ncbi:MAG: hypothetical protein GF355_15575, partial [Candidatus Eisenbacteria bacterium]|nr:hypothetical protein [Candidatus Eisenbacteria bacterium]